MCTVLQFSGGKDSLACLYLLKPRWGEIIVAWVNTGAAFPETVARMEEIRSLVPHFREVRSNQSIATRGYPVDMVPVIAGPIGEFTEGYIGPRFQSRHDCCGFSLWEPLRKAMRDWGVTEIIRGQKQADSRKVPIRDGSVVEGVTYRFPLEGWSDADVMAYLQEHQIALPENYATMSTGLDCWNCTAYLNENRGKLDYLRDHHPQWHRQVTSVLNTYRGLLARASTELEAFA